MKILGYTIAVVKNREGKILANVDVEGDVPFKNIEDAQRLCAVKNERWSTINHIVVAVSEIDAAGAQ